MNLSEILNQIEREGFYLSTTRRIQSKAPAAAPNPTINMKKIIQRAMKQGKLMICTGSKLPCMPILAQEGLKVRLQLRKKEVPRIITSFQFSMQPNPQVQFPSCKYAKQLSPVIYTSAPKNMNENVGQFCTSQQLQMGPWLLCWHYAKNLLTTALQTFSLRQKQLFPDVITAYSGAPFVYQIPPTDTPMMRKEQYSSDLLSMKIDWLSISCGSELQQRQEEELRLRLSVQVSVLMVPL